MAYVEDDKLAGYLLNPSHREGWPKGRFLIGHGFSAADIGAVRQALLGLANNHDVAEAETTLFGIKYRIDGLILAPNGSTLRVGTVWQVDAGQQAPRFVTMIPLPRTP